MTDIADIGGINVRDETIEGDLVLTRRAINVLNAIAGAGATVALTGTNASPTSLDPADGSRFELVSTNDGGVNDFDLKAGIVEGQVLTIVFKTKNTQNVTVTEYAGVTLVAADGTGVASVTFSAANKYLRIRWVGSMWHIEKTDATVA